MLPDASAYNANPPQLCSGAPSATCPGYPSFCHSKLPAQPWEAALCSLLSVSIAASYFQLFLKEHLHQLLESMRERVQNRAALTLQRYMRGFFIQRRFRSLRQKIILLQSRARGFLAR